MPHVDDEHEPRCLGRVPHLVLIAVIEEGHGTLNPLAGRRAPDTHGAIALRYHKGKMAAQAHVCRAAVRAQPRAGCEQGEERRAVHAAGGLSEHRTLRAR